MASLTLTDAQPASAAAAPDWLRLDASQVAMFDERGFQFQHGLHDHPLLQLSRIVDLARTLPEDSVEYNAGDLAVNQDPSSTPRNGLSVEETLQRIETCKSWMVLKGVQQDPAYGR